MSSTIWLRRSRNETCRQQFNRIFDQLEECENYIKKAVDSRLILIVNSELCRELISCIHDLLQISSIYIYGTTTAEDKQWSKNYPKIRNVTEKLENLIDVLEYGQRKQFEIAEPLQISINGNNSEEDQNSSTNINGTFLHSQIIINFLQQIPPNAQDKDEFIQICKHEYQHDAVTLTKIEEFNANNSPKNALWWYTRNTFLYRILNKSLRHFDIHNLFLLRFFIRDLSNELLRLQNEQWRSSITVYRGQSMNREELNRLRKSIGQIISMNSFLSTSIYRDVSAFFLSEQHGSDSTEHILFEINAHADKYTLSKPFANIANASNIPDEGEILFMLGSIFRLNEIYQQDDGVWVIQMTLCNDDDHDLQPLFQHLKWELESPSNLLVQFATHLREAGFYSEAERICQRALSELTEDNNRSAMINRHLVYGQLAALCDEQEKLDESLQWYEKELNILEKLQSPNKAATHTGIGLVYHKQGKFDQARDQFIRALQIVTCIEGDQNESIAGCLFNIARTYSTKMPNHPVTTSKLETAFKYYKQALDIRKECLPENHPDLAASYQNIGLVDLHLGKFEEALENFQRTLEIRKKSFPATHYEIGFIYNNLGSILFQMKKYAEARNYFEKALQIYQHNSFADDHREVVKLKENIQHVNKAM